MPNIKRQIIILFGPPGAGKGTQAELLADKLSLFYFETSKILEEKFRMAESRSSGTDSPERIIKVEGKDYDIISEKNLWKEGKLCSPPFVTRLVEEKIKKVFEEGQNIVIAGSPRTLYEAERITPLLKDLYGKENIKVILIDISAEQTVFRNSHRRICELMRHPILWDKETENLTICPLDGSKLIKREGLDDPESIKVRLKEYEARTFPVFEYFGKEGIAVRKIKGEQSVANVFANILQILNIK